MSNTPVRIIKANQPDELDVWSLPNVQEKESQEQAAQILEYSKTQAKRIASDAFDAKASLKDEALETEV